jgi:hypothetical protein
MSLQEEQPELQTLLFLHRRFDAKMCTFAAAAVFF